MALSEKAVASIRRRVQLCVLTDDDIDELRRLLPPPPRPYVEAPPDVGEQ